MHGDIEYVYTFIVLVDTEQFWFYIFSTWRKQLAVHFPYPRHHETEPKNFKAKCKEPLPESN